MTLYAVVRPASGHPDLTASLAVVPRSADDRHRADDVAKAGADGFIRQLIRIPLPALATGSYTIRLALGDGQNLTSRSAKVLFVR